MPSILPDPGGGVNLYWKANGYELFIYVPASPGSRRYGGACRGARGLAVERCEKTLSSIESR